MVCIYKGVVKDNAIVLDEEVRLPDGARVEVRVENPLARQDAQPNRKEAFEAILKHRAFYEGRHINIDELIEEEKQDREERFDHWLFPNSE
jgi:hypothetical protein